jgi:hypothetical protein
VSAVRALTVKARVTAADATVVSVVSAQPEAMPTLKTPATAAPVAHATLTKVRSPTATTASTVLSAASALNATTGTSAVDAAPAASAAGATATATTRQLMQSQMATCKQRVQRHPKTTTSHVHHGVNVASVETEANEAHAEAAIATAMSKRQLKVHQPMRLPNRYSQPTATSACTTTAT